MSRIIRQTSRNTHKATWKIALVVGALAATMAGAMPAMAADPQSTDAANDNAANWRMGGPSAHAEAPAPHRSGAYASARPDQPTAAARPIKGFQDYK
jgi:hypothetical protein